MPERYDVVIVGAGFGGGILAARIAERGVNPRTGERLRIALMDMGPYLIKGEPRPGYGIPLRRQMYVNLPGIDDFQKVTPWGTIAGIGGQSLHWGANTQLPTEEEHEDWVNETGVDWTYEKLTDARTEITEMFHIAPLPEELVPPGAFKFRDVATKMGYSVHRNTRAVVNCIMCGRCPQNGCKYDAKSNILVRYIPIAEQHGVEIMPETTVEKVIIEKKGAGGVARGVVYTRDGMTQEARADSVILACNSLGTPVLLFKSGYGPRDKVNNLILENPHVGKYATVSLSNSVLAVFDEPVKRADAGWGGSFRLVDRGPQGYLNLQLRDSFGYHGYRGHFLFQMALNDVAPEFGREHKEYIKKWLHFGSLDSFVIRQRYVTGEVSPTGQLIVNRSHPAISKRAQEGRELAKDILLKMGARRTSDISKPVDAGPRASDNSSGTCRAGSDRNNSVINSDFECHDIENLLICDDSVIPPSGGGGSTTALLACYAWRRIVANHFSRV